MRSIIEEFRKQEVINGFKSLLGIEKDELSDEDILKLMILEFREKLKYEEKMDSNRNENFGVYGKSILKNDNELIEKLNNNLKTVSNKMFFTNVEKIEEYWTDVFSVLNKTNEENKEILISKIKEYNEKTNGLFTELSLFNNIVESKMSDLRYGNKSKFLILLDCGYNPFKSDIVSASQIVNRGNINYEFAKKITNMGFNLDWVIPFGSAFNKSQEMYNHPLWKLSKDKIENFNEDYLNLIVDTTKGLNKEAIMNLNRLLCEELYDETKKDYVFPVIDATILKLENKNKKLNMKHA